MTLSKVQQVWVERPSKQVSNPGYGASHSGLPLSSRTCSLDSGHQELSCARASTSAPFAQPLLLRSQIPQLLFLECFLRTQTLTRAFGILSSEVGPLLPTILQVRELRQRKVKHFACGYAVGISGPAPRAISLVVFTR